MKNKKVKKLRELCNEIHQERREEVETVFKCWLADFIKDNRPWGAIIGKKRFVAIPMYKSFSNERIRNLRNEKKFFDRYLPDLPNEEIKEIIESLGFVVFESKYHESEGHFCIAVPAYEKGKPLTFAQEYVRKINHHYSVYVQEEKRKAEKLFDELITELRKMPIEKIKRCKGFTLFEGFKLEKTVSPICGLHCRRLLKKSGIEDYYEDGEYLGVAVKDEK